MKFAQWFRWRFARPRTLYVIRLADMLRVHPQMVTYEVCDVCQEQVGIYPSGQRVLQIYRRVEILCNHCASPPLHAALAPGALYEPLESTARSD